MPNGKLNTAIGYGDATVWNPQGAIQNFTSILAQQQAKRQAEQNQLASELTRVKTDGLRNEADRKVFFDKYSGIKDIAAQIPYEKNNWKKAQLKSQVDQGLLELKDYAVKSKQQGINEADWSKSYMAHPEMWGDDALTAAQKSKQAALTGDGVIDDFTTLHRRPDADKIQKDLALAVAANLKGQPWETIQEVGKEGNKTGITVSNKRKINPEQVLTTAGMYYDAHPDMQRAMQLAYPDIYANNDPKTAKALALSTYVNDGLNSQAFGATTESKPSSFKADWKPDNWKEKAMWHLNHPGKKASDEVTYFQDLSERMRTATPGSGEEFNEQIAKNPDYLHGIKINNQDPANVVIDVPAKYKQGKVKRQNEQGDEVSVVERVVDKPGYRVTLDSTDPQLWTAGLAKVYKDLTGDTFASPSKALTQSGKGKVPGGMNPVNKTKTPAGTPLVNKSKKAASDYGL